MNKIVDLSLRLMIVCAIAALALAITYTYTIKQIDEQKTLEVNNALKNVIPGADDFKVKDGYYEAYKNEQIIGYAKIVSKSGYSSTIQLMVGIDPDKKITGVSVISQEETPGLGTNIKKKEFLDQFIGKDITTVALKKYGGKIDGITGATVSSQATIDALKSWDMKDYAKIDAVTGATNIAINNNQQIVIGNQSVTMEIK